MIHRRGAISDDPISLKAYEYSLEKGTTYVHPLQHSIHPRNYTYGRFITYGDERIVSTKAGQIRATANLLPAKGEATEQQLIAAVRAILAQKRPSQVTPSARFKNCLHFVWTSMVNLKTQGYITNEELQPFVAFYEENNKEVKRLTDPLTMQRCGVTPSQSGSGNLEARGLECKKPSSKGNAPTMAGAAVHVGPTKKASKRIGSKAANTRRPVSKMRAAPTKKSKARPNRPRIRVKPSRGH